MGVYIDYNPGSGGRVMKYLKQLFCKHIWIDDYIVYETLWPYTMAWKKVKRCAKCGRILRRAE